MDRKHILLIRNIAAGIVLLIFLLLIAVWLGVFEGEQSEEAQIRELMDRARDEINDHDWDDFLLLCDLDETERAAWLAAIPRQADFVVVDTLEPLEFISVPPGSHEYVMNVNALAHLQAPIIGNIRADSVNGTLHFVKIGDRWRIDLNRSASTFPYIPKPKSIR